MNYLLYLFIAIISIVLSVFTWIKYDAFTMKNLFKHYKKTLCFFLVIAITIVTFLTLVKRNYDYVDIVKIAIVYSVLLTVAMIDYKFHRIPNQILISACIIRICLMCFELFYYENELFKGIVISCVIGAVISFLFLSIISKMTKQGIGMGDIKLFSVIGFSLGLLSAYYILFYALIILVVYTVIEKFRNKVDRKSKIPFGPFIYIGYIFVLLAGGI